MVTVVRLLLRGGDVGQIVGPAKDEAERLFAGISSRPGARVRVMEIVPGAAAETPHGRAFRGVPFEVVLEVGVEGASYAELIELVAGVGERLGEAVDLGASYALAGKEYVFSPGETDLVLFVLIGRDPDEKTYEDVHRHWLTRHGWLVKPNADARGSGYRQFHADPKASSLTARSAVLGGHEFEGMAVGFQTSVEGYSQRMNRSGDRITEILEDEKNFIDAPTSSPGLYRVVAAHAQN